MCSQIVRESEWIINLWTRDGRKFIDMLETSNKDGKPIVESLDKGSHSALYVLKDTSTSMKIVKVTFNTENDVQKGRIIQNEKNFMDLVSNQKNPNPIAFVVESYGQGELFFDEQRTKKAGHYFIYEYLTGKLTQLKCDRVLSEKHCVAIIHQVALGLNGLVALNKNFVHRDISLNNIMYRENNNSHLIFKLIDFGTSIIEPTISRKDYHNTPTTANINAPEIRDPKLYRELVDNMEDIYSLGMCLFMLLSQQLKKYGSPQVLPR
jgi:serine/threonine protein kinase